MRFSRREVLKAGAISMAALGASPALGQAPGCDVDGIETEIHRLLERTGLPGLSLALVEDGRLAHVRAFGYANKQSGQPVTPDTIFQAASLTKPTFAYVVLKLCEEGKLALDVPLVRTYLPELPPSDDARTDRITARMVLSHTSGLPITHAPKWPEKLDFEPGERFGYSGAAYIYLQKVVETVTGKPLDALMRRYVLEPLSLDKSAYTWRPNYETDAALAYDYDGTPIKEEERSRPQKASAAASLHTTPRDFARFLIELLFKPNGALPLDRVLKRAMLSPQVRLTDSLAWGLGWGLYVAEDGDRFWHWGDSRGYMCYAAGSLAERRAVVVFTNGRHGLRVSEQVAAKVMGAGESRIFSWIYDDYALWDTEIPPLPTSPDTPSALHRDQDGIAKAHRGHSRQTGKGPTTSTPQKPRSLYK